MTKPRQRGFTLIELIIFIVVVGVGLTGILSVMNTVVKSSADPLVRKQTIAIAESLMEEILLREYIVDITKYPECVPQGGLRKDNDWLYVCDYKGYTTSTGIVNSQGDPVVGLTSYNISPPVLVEPTTMADVDNPSNTVYLFRVTVSVTGPGGNTITLTGYRGNDKSSLNENP